MGGLNYTRARLQNEDGFGGVPVEAHAEDPDSGDILLGPCIVREMAVASSSTCTRYVGSKSRNQERQDLENGLVCENSAYCRERQTINQERMPQKI